ncbi:hypothetical protein MMC07_009714, partial [Pseudocyphellaria aurata]|nr:hypothetical protein [Pseudocyphellaria aurata]
MLYSGPTNQTLLLVNNDQIRSGFSYLAQQYNINSPDTFVDRLIANANGNSDPSEGDSFTLTTPLNAAIVLTAFANSHTLKAPYDFYANESVSLNAIALSATHVHIAVRQASSLLIAKLYMLINAFQAVYAVM